MKNKETSLENTCVNSSRDKDISEALIHIIVVEPCYLLLNLGTGLFWHKGTKPFNHDHEILQWTS